MSSAACRMRSTSRMREIVRLVIRRALTVCWEIAMIAVGLALEDFA
jgi:hypothetical protein